MNERKSLILESRSLSDKLLNASNHRSCLEVERCLCDFSRVTGMKVDFLHLHQSSLSSTCLFQLRVEERLFIRCNGFNNVEIAEFENKQKKRFASFFSAVNCNYFYCCEFKNCTFRDIDFSNNYFVGTLFLNCKFEKCRFGENYLGVLFENCSFDKEVIFTSTNHPESETKFKGCNFPSSEWLSTTKNSIKKSKFSK